MRVVSHDRTYPSPLYFQLGGWLSRIGGAGALTIGNGADGKHASIVGEVGQRGIGGAFADHEVHCDETLEDDGPCRIS